MSKNTNIAVAHFTNSINETNSNAKLIAAAPELLNALEKILSWNDEALSEFLSECEITEARHQIAKAKGE